MDYVISTLDRRKTERVCRVNLLKPYHERDPELDPVVASIPADVLDQSPVIDEMGCPAPRRSRHRRQFFLWRRRRRNTHSARQMPPPPKILGPRRRESAAAVNATLTE